MRPDLHALANYSGGTILSGRRACSCPVRVQAHPNYRTRVRDACSSGVPARDLFVLRRLQTTAGVLSQRCASRPGGLSYGGVESGESLLRGHRLYQDRAVSPTGGDETRRALLPNASSRYGPPTGNSPFFHRVAGACHRDVERFMKHPNKNIDIFMQILYNVINKHWRENGINSRTPIFIENPRACTRDIPFLVRTSFSPTWPLNRAALAWNMLEKILHFMVSCGKIISQQYGYLFSGKIMLTENRISVIFNTK